MSDSERTFLDLAIIEVLPELQAVNKDILVEHLQSIGVETYDDLRFVKEADLVTALRPVQARKLLSVWKQKCKYLTHYHTPQHTTTQNQKWAWTLCNIVCVNHKIYIYFCHLKMKLLRTAHNHLWKPCLPIPCRRSLFHLKAHCQPPPAVQDLMHSGKTTLKFHGGNSLKNLCSLWRGEKGQAQN